MPLSRGLRDLNAALRQRNHEDRRRAVDGPDGAKRTCADCGVAVEEGFATVPLPFPRVFCRDCYRWRSGRLLTFDPRSREVLEREVA